jgi:hypothetical protein
VREVNSVGEVMGGDTGRVADQDRIWQSVVLTSAIERYIDRVHE